MIKCTPLICSKHEKYAAVITDYAAGIADKLIRRHPHVFADVVYASETEQKQAWEELKASERAEKEVENHTILAGVAKNLPALVQCKKIQDRAANHGFDWTEVEPVYDKVIEELEEVKEAWESRDQEHIEEEIGDLLLVAVNLARHMQVEPEQALIKSTRKFSRRFEYIENKVVQSGREVKQCELEELDSLWNEAKIALKKSIKKKQTVERTKVRSTQKYQPLVSPKKQQEIKTK